MFGTSTDYVPIQMNRPRLLSSHTLEPLSEIVDAFERIAKVVDSRKSNGTKELRLDDFCDACSSVSILFGCLGLAFKFGDIEYTAKVRDITEASKRFTTLQQMVDSDLTNGTLRRVGSHSRNLRRVRQGIELVKLLFENFLSSDEQSLKEAATTAYAQACAPYHSWAVRTAVYAGIYSLPSRDQLLFKLHETNESAEKKMRRFITTAGLIIEYIDKVYTSRNIRLDW
ncbi:hypothetical protein MLD38_017493 [Melastoma candidum]|uniref:Uncharacterized protein n=1 Tax=Melastoma candidum TaxID=119954 RepID=A0ACB9QQR0_9MYRT|nr:hypothetical protein MLD38_017493 [Melastoma candidum]